MVGERVLEDSLMLARLVPLMAWFRSGRNRHALLLMILGRVLLDMLTWGIRRWLRLSGISVRAPLRVSNDTIVSSSSDNTGEPAINDFGTFDLSGPC